jgi:glycosyltransferase involved in cell wall biosynthesis
MTAQSSPSLSVVLPLFRTRDALPGLVQRLTDALGELELPGGHQLVFVDDACPQRSGEEVERRRATWHGDVVLCRHDANRGQQAAVVTGLRAAGGELVAVMDADLQDAPEDLPRLVRELRSAPPEVGAVAAGRRGAYQSAGRRRSARMFRRALHLLTSRRIPADAGMFLVMRASARDRVLALGDDRVHLVAGLGRARVIVKSIPVERRARPSGSSSYDGPARLRAAAAALVVVTPFYPLVRWTRRRRLS